MLIRLATFRAFTFVLTLGLALPGASQAQAKDWQHLSDPVWQGDKKAGGSFDLSQDIVQTWLAPEKVQGHWLRASAMTRVDAPDFKVWFHVFGAAGRIMELPLPST